jgi:hypothetical protein
LLDATATELNDSHYGSNSPANDHKSKIEQEEIATEAAKVKSMDVYKDLQDPKKMLVLTNIKYYQDDSLDGGELDTSGKV